MENGFKLIKKGQRNVQGFHVQTDKEKQMETYLRNNFPEYNELEFYMAMSCLSRRLHKAL